LTRYKLALNSLILKAIRIIAMRSSNFILKSAVVIAISCTPLSAFADKSWSKKSVRKAQSILNMHGYKVGAEDGIWGTKTQVALKQFCNDRKLDCDNDEDEVIDTLKDEASLYCDKRYTPSAGELNPTSYDRTFKLSSTYGYASRTVLPSFENFTNGKEVAGDHPDSTQAIIRAVADFNLDGMDDLIVTFHETQQKSMVLYSDGEGGFEKVWLPEASKSRLLREVSVGDFNNDGRPDIYGHTAPHDWTKRSDNYKKSDTKFGRDEPDFLLINIPDGFKEIDISDLTNGNNHQGAVADLNADGFLDIISLDQKENFEGRSEFFLYGSKDLTFSKAQPVPNTLAKMQYHDVEAGDVNNDGLVDLVISRVLPQTNIMSPGELIILLNTAKGIENGKILKVGKFLQDAQRWKDVLEYRQCLAEKQGFGDPYEARPGTSEITLHDYDNDGDLDIFYTQHIGGSFKNRGSIDKGSRIKLLRNEYPDFVDITETVIPDQRPLEVYTRKYGVGRPFKIFFSDVNLDDKADLILSGYSKSFHEIDNGAVSQNPYIYLFDGSKYDAVHRDDTGDLQWRSQYTPADLNGDGINDFVTVRFARKTVKHHVIDTYLAFPWLK